MKFIIHKRFGITSTQLLIGLAVVVIIVAVVAAPRILRQAGKEHHAKAADDIETLGIALDMYAKDNGDYPSTAQGLRALLEKPELPPHPVDWKGPYIKVPITHDSWGNEYVYIRPGLRDKYGYDLIAFGSDKREGGRGDKEDITNWVRPEE